MAIAGRGNDGDAASARIAGRGGGRRAVGAFLAATRLGRLRRRLRVRRRQPASGVAADFVVALARTSRRTSSAPTASDAADLAAERDDVAGDRRRDLDRRLVGHHGGEDLVLEHRLADLDMPFDDLGLGHAFADIGQLDDRLPISGLHHGLESARPTRAGPGK